MPIVVGRPINGISVNGLEYLLDENTDSGFMTFETKEKALEFVRENVFPDATDEELNNYFTFREESDVVKEEKDGASDGFR